LILSEQLAPLEKRLHQARKEGLIRSEYLGHQIAEAQAAEVINADEAAQLSDYHAKVLAIQAVNDFAPDELGRAGGAGERAATRKAAKAKAAGRRKTERKEASAADPDPTS